MKKKKEKIASLPAAPQRVFRHWFLYAVLFLGYSAWAMLKYDSEFFPFRGDVLWDILSPDRFSFPPFSLLALYGKSIGLFVLFLSEAAWIGWITLTRLARLEASALEKAVLATGLGLAFFSLLSTFLGFAHAQYRVVYWAIFLAGSIPVLMGSLTPSPWRSFWGEVWRELHQSWKMAGLGLFKVLVCLLLGFNLVMDFTPEIFYDSLFYHMALPDLYLMEHRIVNLPYMNFSKFPQGMEMLFSWGLALQGDTFTKLLHGTMGFLTFLALLIISKRMGNLRYWPIAGAILLTIPVVSICLWNSSVDVTLLFYSLLTLYAMFSWLNPPAAGRRAWVILTGVFAGMAASAKYMGGSVLIAVGVTVLWVYWRRGLLRRTAFAEILLCGTICLFWVGPWFVRNAVDTGNPFYPLLYRFFGGKYLWPDHLEGLMGEVRGYVPHDLWGWFRIPWALTTGEPKGPENTCWLGPTFWVMLPALFFIPRQQGWLTLLAPYTLVNFFAESFSTNQARYLLQGYAGLALLLAAGFVCFYDHGVRGFRGLLLFPLLGAVCSNMYGAALTAHNCYQPLSVLSGQVSRIDYQSVYHQGMNPNPVVPLYEFMRQHPERVGRVVFVSEEKTYGCPWPYVYGNVRDRAPLLEWNRESADPAALYRRFQEKEVRYLLYNEREGYRLKAYGLFYWSDDEKARFEKFWETYVRPVYAKDALELFEVLPPDQARGIPLYPCPFLRFPEN